MALILASAMVCGRAYSQREAPAGGTSVLAADALLTTPVGGLERTQATSQVVPVTGQPFKQALRVVVRTDAAETNATQLTLPIAAPVAKGDALLASFSIRGATAKETGAAQIAFLFERRVDPWTKSITQTALSARRPQAWKRILVPFTAAESYAPGEAMVSLRFAFGSQTVEVGGLSVVNYGKSRTRAELNALAVEQNPLGNTGAVVRFGEPRQTMVGFGGDFCQPRYGATEPMDAVGNFNLRHLRVAHARVGIPLNLWTPERGVYREDAPVRAAFLQMQMLARRKIPIVGSVWEGPFWILGGKPEESRRTLPPERYADCIEAITRFLVTARDKYGVTVDYFSFNEPDYGVNFRFTSAQMRDFIRQAGPHFQARGLKTKFLIGDTTGGAALIAYARPLLEDREITPYLGPLAFHCWDALSTPDMRYTDIAALGREFHKPVWCTEAGYDSQLWERPDPWGSWENALQTTLAYEKTLRLSGAVLMDYWTYQDNYPLVTKDGARPYPVFRVIRQMEKALPAGAKIVPVVSDSENLRALAALGPKKGQFSLLLVNPVGAGQVTLAGLPAGSAVTVIRSTARTQEERISMPARVSRSGRLTLSLPSRAVLTVIGGR